MTSAEQLPVVLITGISAAGKSTVAQLLAERFDRAVHVRGDLFRKMVVRGQVHMTAERPAEAVHQLWLRHQLTASTVDAYRQAGFAVVAQDIVIAENLRKLIDEIKSRPLHLVVLAPDPDTVTGRELTRPKKGYDENWTPHDLDRLFRKETPKLGLWLDNSDQTPDETVDEILERLPEARVG